MHENEAELFDQEIVPSKESVRRGQVAKPTMASYPPLQKNTHFAVKRGLFRIYFASTTLLRQRTHVRWTFFLIGQLYLV